MLVILNSNRLRFSNIQIFSFIFLFYLFKDTYTSFGRLIDPNDVLIRSLESQGLQQLYSLSSSSSNQVPGADSNRTYINTNNHKRELKKLNHSILIAYLDLLEILVKAPNTQIQIEQPAPVQTNELGEQIQNPEPIIIIKTLREQKLQDIELLFINMHHLINELRPHQARDNIRCILEMQKQQRVEIAQKFKSHLYKIVDLLKSCIQSIQPSSNLSKSKIFMDELNLLISSANNIQKSLDKFSTHNNVNSRKTNGFAHSHESMQTDFNNEDIEMRSNTSEIYDEQQNNLIDLVNNKNQKFYSGDLADLKETKVNCSSSSQIQINNKNCDFKDLILCDLIDEFLIKENEF